MTIDDKLITYLEDLSYLTLGDDEKKRLAEELGKILGGMALLNEVDTKSVPERSHPFDNVNVFRDDEVTKSVDREVLLKNAPVHNFEAFVVPKTVE